MSQHHGHRKAMARGDQGRTAFRKGKNGRDLLGSGDIVEQQQHATFDFSQLGMKQRGKIVHPFG